MDAFRNFDTLIAVYFVVPGFVGLLVYGALRPVERLLLKDAILEIVTFSTMNFILVGWSADLVRDTYLGPGAPIQRSLILLLAFVVVPAILGWLTNAAISWLEMKGYILSCHRNGWDAYFSRRQPCWITVHLKDGRRIGGLFSSNSFAGLYPNSGHLYLEQVWTLDANGAFEAKVDRTEGLIIRPEEWKFVELFADEGISEHAKPD